jgi:hypothetical protein
VAVYGVVGWMLVSSESPLNRASAIKVTREWARLAPLPPSATKPEIEVRGGMFTREFVISFSAPSDEVQAWLQSSPGIRDAKITQESDGGVTYTIAPGGGAQFAELRLSADRRGVTIRAYWS